MARAMVVYESYFGDGKRIAEAIGRGMVRFAKVDVVEVGRASTEIGSDVHLLVVGSPNHAFGLPRPDSRSEAESMTDQPLISQGVGLREWIPSLQVPSGLKAVVYDTRMDHPRLVRHVDHASHSAEKLLRKRGIALLLPAEHYFVEGPQGPLVEGEVARAENWGAELGAAVVGAMAV